MWQPRDFLADATFPSIGGYVTGTLFLARRQYITWTESAPLARKCSSKSKSYLRFYDFE